MTILDDAAPWLSARDRAQRVAAALPRDLLIDGEWRPSAAGRIDVRDPATEEVVATVADATPADGAKALDAAVAAAPSWARRPPHERAAVLGDTAALLRARADDLAAALTLEMGKPLAQSHGEIAYAADFFDWYAGEALRLPGGLTDAADGLTRVATTRAPVGPCVLVTPWNFPAAMPARKLAPALAAGCTAVLKPSELTPLTANAIAQALIDAGLPRGVVNVVPTTQPGALVRALLEDPRTRKLSFTGSTPVGKALMAQAAANVLRVSLELGGNAPFLVCADADLDAAVEGALLAKLRNCGEACTAANRFYVDRRVVDEFTERLVAKMCAMRIGHGLDDGVELGPLINGAGVSKARRVVDNARAEGASIITGVDAPSDLAGSFFPATVLAGVPADSAALTEEIFAPVAPIVTVDSDETALRLANQTPYGLVAYVFTRDLERARWLASGLEVGMVGLNSGLVSNAAAPFGGVKWSGLGREGGAAGLEEYLETKYFAIGRLSTVRG